MPVTPSASSPLTPEQRDYCRAALVEVSRTFALGIGLLRDPLRDEIGVAYLICRILDTIEDTTSLPAPDRARLLRQCAGSISDPAKCVALAPSIENFFSSSALTGRDHVLCRRASTVLGAYARLASEAHAALRPAIDEMADGMAQTVERELRGAVPMTKASGPALALADERDLDQYCYYVAGTVGKLLTSIFAARCPAISGDVLARLNQHAVNFGLGLQITNVIKGITDDFGRGVVYLPRSFLAKADTTLDELLAAPDSAKARAVVGLMVQHTLRYLDDAAEYTLAIPRGERDIRLFCALPLLFALRTLALSLADPATFSAADELKITRAEVGALHSEAENAACDDTALRGLFARERARVAVRLHEALQGVGV